MRASRLPALLAVTVCACLPAVAQAAPPPAAKTARLAAHKASGHHRRARCVARRHRPRSCPAVRRGALAGHRGARLRRASGAHPRRTHAGRKGATGRSTAAGATLPTVATGVVAPAVSCANADLIPAAENLSVVEAATLCLINQVRAKHGLRALAPNANLQAAAVRHDDDMVAQDYFDHTGPAGDTPLSRIRDSGYLSNPASGYEIGENIAWGTGTDATPQAIVQAWVNSPEHLANILDAHYADSGLAVVAAAPQSVSGGAAGATYTQDFGVVD